VNVGITFVDFDLILRCNVC